MLQISTHYTTGTQILGFIKRTNSAIETNYYNSIKHHESISLRLHDVSIILPNGREVHMSIICTIIDDDGNIPTPTFYINNYIEAEYDTYIIKEALDRIGNDGVKDINKWTFRNNSKPERKYKQRKQDPKDIYSAIFIY